MARTLKEIAEFVQARLVGDGSVVVSGIASVETATAADLVFAQDEKNLEVALQSQGCRRSPEISLPAGVLPSRC